ncbi:MAG: sodium:solute symporter family protein [Longimicrobiales bacterium]
MDFLLGGPGSLARGAVPRILGVNLGRAAWPEQESVWGSAAAPVARFPARREHHAPTRTRTQEGALAQVTDLLVVGAYFAVMLTVGWRARTRSPEAYWVAGRSGGPLPVAASLVATIFGASSTVGLVGLAYGRGLTGAWWSLVGGLALVPFAFILAPRVRRLGVITLPDILERAYGARVALAGALVVALAWCGVVAAQIVAGGLLLGGIFHLPPQGTLAVVAAVFILYTFWGGQPSVIRTDAWQLVLFCVALLATLALVLRSVLAGEPPAAELPAGFLSFPVSPEFGWYQVLVFYPLIVGLPYLVGPDIYSRVLCARDENAARRAALTAAGIVALLSFVLALLGVLIRVRFPGLHPEGALPHAVMALAPAGLKGLIVAGLLGAVMSSADTTLISAATILSRNVVSPLAAGALRGGGGRTRLGPDRQLTLTRGLVVVVGAVAWSISAFHQGIVASLLLAYTVFVGGVVLPTLASFWRERLGVTSAGALWAVALGGGCAALGSLGGGTVLAGVLGEGATAFLEGALGPGWASLLPLVVSALALLGTRSRAQPRR